MKTISNPAQDRKFLQTILRTVLVGASLMLGLTGCPLSGFLGASSGPISLRRPVQLAVTIVPDEVTVGTTATFEVTTDALPGTESIYLRGDSRGVRLDSITSLAPLNGGQLRYAVQVTIAPDAPHVPIEVGGIRQGEGGGMVGGLINPFIAEGVGFIYVRAGSASAPRLTSLTPDTIRQGGTVTVAIEGRNFDASTELAVASFDEAQFGPPGLEVNDVTVVSETLAFVTLIASLNARTGFIPLAVRTAAGSSAPVNLYVQSQAPALVVHRLYPNHIEAGTSQRIVAVGEHFETGQTVESVEPASLEITRPLLPADAFMGAFQARVPDAMAQGLRPLTFHSVRGSAGPLNVRLLRSEVRGPRLRTIRGNNRVAPGATAQFILETNDRVDTTFLVESVPGRNGSTLSATALYGFTPIASFGRQFIAEVQVSPSASIGTAALGLISANRELSTDLATFQIVPKPVGGRPFVQRTRPGIIPRGTTQSVTIEGEGLGRITAIRCASRGLSAIPGEVSNGGTSLRATFTAAPDAELTGDALTTFVLLNEFNDLSNLGSIVVR